MNYTDKEKEGIYRDFYGKVFGYIMGKIGNKQIAEDLSADVFLKVFENLESFDANKSSISTWIFTVTRNTLIDYYRTRHTSEEFQDALQDNISVEDEVCREEMLETLADALESMDERERDIIILRFYKGMTLTEIANNMGISYAYVKVLQNKAFGVLKKYFNF